MSSSPPPSSFTTALTEFKKLQQNDLTDKHAWGGIYHLNGVLGKHISTLQSKAFSALGSSNALYPSVWPSVTVMQSELLTYCIRAVNGGTEARGLLTSGGTESILLAMLSYRETFQASNCNTKDRPTIIASASSHGAAAKAAFYFNMQLILVQPNPITLRIGRKEVEPFVNHMTAVIYASAPSFPHGVCDDCVSLGLLAKENNCGLHVDNCLGGVLLQSMYSENLLIKGGAAYAFAKHGMQIPGVTSVSFDLHKYGFTSKGVSAVIFANAEMRRKTFHPVVPVPGNGISGGGYITSTIQGSRGGGAIATAWITVHAMKNTLYRESAQRIHFATTTIRQSIENVQGVESIGDAEICIVAMRVVHGSSLSTRGISKAMRKRGWVLFNSENPQSLGICIGEQHYESCKRFGEDLHASVVEVRVASLTKEKNKEKQQKKSIVTDGPYQAGESNEKKATIGLIRFIESTLDSALKTSKL